MKSNASLMRLCIFAFLMFLISGYLHAQYSWNNLPVVKSTSFKKDTFNIKKFGAKADGITLCSRSINDAIAACNIKGGGVVIVPKGLWLTGPVEMKSNVNLHLQKGAMLLFTTDKSQYKLTEGSYEGKPAARNQSPIWGNDLENIAVTGNGIIDGNGDTWRAVAKRQLTPTQWAEKLKTGGVLNKDSSEWYPSEQFRAAKQENKSMLLSARKNLSDFEDMKDFLRPNLVVFTNCKRVLLEGNIFQNSGAWCLHPLLCEDLIIRNVMVKNPEYAQNGDGMDIESCSNFLIENCLLDVGDDAICIKSGKDEDGRKRGKPTQNGIIRNNTIYKGHGGVVIGSEMSGGARNIFVSNCSFMGTDKGLRFKSTRGRGGVVENIYARDLVMKDIVDEAIFFDMFYLLKFATDGERDTRPIVNDGTPIFRNMHFENIVCNGAKKGIFIRGLSEMPVSSIRISNCTLNTEIGTELVDAANITLENIYFNTTSENPVIVAENVMGLTASKLTYPSQVKKIIKVSGKNSRDINISKAGANMSNDMIEVEAGAAADAVKMK
ncbi:MAG: glycoside hydrolase family 28 protein [Bacteroidota bacterium]